MTRPTGDVIDEILQAEAAKSSGKVVMPPGFDSIPDVVTKPSLTEWIWVFLRPLLTSALIFGGMRLLSWVVEGFIPKVH